MAIHKFRTLRASKYLATEYKKRGYKAQISKRKKGYAVRVTRK